MPFCAWRRWCRAAATAADDTVTVIAGTSISKDDEGRYCLTDLHRAAGGDPKHKPSEWLRNKQATELADEI